MGLRYLLLSSGKCTVHGHRAWNDMMCLGVCCGLVNVSMPSWGGDMRACRVVANDMRHGLHYLLSDCLLRRPAVFHKGRFLGDGLRHVSRKLTHRNDTPPRFRREDPSTQTCSLQSSSLLEKQVKKAEA